MRMEKIYEEFGEIFASKTSRHVKAFRLTRLYSRMGTSSKSLDDMLYREIGLSCEDIVMMLRKGNMKIC